MNATSLLMFLLLDLLQVKTHETHLHNITKLTNGGDNAEAYFSPDGKKLTMQISNPKANIHCDQIFIKDLNNADSVNNLSLVSTGKGRTTCSFFMPDGKHILYASTHETDTSCPAPPKARQDGKYVWAIYPSFDIYISDLKGKIVKKLTNSPGYDAEAVVSPDGKKICFTSMRSGDLELWTMNLDGSNLKQITNELGYDGGAFFSHDSKKLVYRASRPNTPEEISTYKNLLVENLVMPTAMELYTCNIDGTNKKQITHLGKANWAPYFHPNNDKIIFASNHHSTRGYDFQLYLVDTNGNRLKQITWESNFNAFPMFSPDGKKLAFSSNRNQSAPHETNVFIADWVEVAEKAFADQGEMKKHILYLSSDELEGRLAGSKSEKKAATYIAADFKMNGLEPLINNKFFQPFSYQVNTNPRDSLNPTLLKVNSNNVVCYLNNQANKTIVIGAHYDHLGRNEHHNSTKVNSKGEIHNGADDNASGVSAVLALSKMLSQNNIKEKANFIFVCFSGEEDGLMGSKNLAAYLIANHKLPITMINMDMIGRVDSLKNLVVTGVGTSPIFPDLVEKLKPGGYNISLDSSGIGPSDHTSFYLQNKPVLNFFSGAHHDYHKPTDDADKINYTGVENVCNYVYRIVMNLCSFDSIPFTKTKMAASKSTPRYKVTLGIMPDYTNYGDGLHVDGVSDNRPAQKAGIEAGDILLKIDKCDIKEVYSYMECLSNFKIGDKVKVHIKRKNDLMILDLEF